MAQITEELNIPKLGGEIQVMASGALIHWFVVFRIPGPDARYLPARVSFSDSTLGQFIAAGESALSLAAKLCSTPLTGQFEKQYPIHGDYVRVTSDSGDIRISLCARSSTGKYFSAVMSPEQFAEALKILTTVEGRIQPLIESLKLLNS